MKIATWNVNSIRVREDQVLDWLEATGTDILCLQETKTTDQEFPEDSFGDLGYDVELFGQRAYNGVAIASRDEMRDVVRGFPHDDDSADRRLIAATIGRVRVVNVYVPNGQEVGAEKYEYKLEWLGHLHRFIEGELKRHPELVLCGDFNIAPLDIDVWNAEEIAGGLYVSPPEREAFRSLLALGLSDGFRHHQPEAKQYSWWGYMGGGFERNRGMRIDHLLVSRTIVERSRGVTIDKKERARKNPSDHVPVVLDLDDVEATDR